MINETWLAFGALALVATLVVAIVTLLRLSALARERELAGRDAAELRARIDAYSQAAAEHERDMRTDLATARKEQGDAASALRREVGERLTQFQDGTQRSLADANTAQREQLRQFGERLGELTQTVERKLDGLRDENTKKLDEMRATVDEKLQSTLETRLGESFKQVSDRLEQVHRGLGEMQNLAVGVGDLKRVLGNVKTRGGWGEVQLAALLADALTPQQYEKNVETRRGSNERVEFAIRLPGRDDQGQPCWLPIDAKFPLDDWQRLQEALERADIAAAEAARRALVDFLRQQARSIRDKYVEPPQTTDFAILFLPTEGLYAEMLSRPGFADALQREYRVMLAGPMSLWALLNSLQMGFRTLAIEQRSSEVWRVLGAVKTEFRKFGDVLTKTKDRIDKASEELEKAGVRRRALERQLRSVDELPEPEAVRLIGTDGAFDAGEGPEEK
ncbi:MAG: DNA recombination protein RmuC [Casimicrobiaceae bacterium]